MSGWHYAPGFNNSQSGNHGESVKCNRKRYWRLGLGRFRMMKVSGPMVTRRWIWRIIQSV